MGPRGAYYSHDSIPEPCVAFCAHASLGKINPKTCFLGSGNRDIWHAKTVTPPHRPILIDSVSPGTVVGPRWLKQWGPTHPLPLEEIDPHFRFGDGIGRPSNGVCAIQIGILQRRSNHVEPLISHVSADVVRSDDTLLFRIKLWYPYRHGWNSTTRHWHMGMPSLFN